MKMTVANFDRITIDHELMNGQPCIRGMRITVKRVLEALTVYPQWEELIAEYPELEKEDIRQALAFAAENIDDTIIVKEIAITKPAAESIRQGMKEALEGNTLPVSELWNGIDAR